MNFKKYHVSRNLFDSTILQNDKGISSNGNVIDQSGRISTVVPINVSEYSAVTLTYVGDNVQFIYATFNSGILVERVAGKDSGYTINTTNCDSLYICFYRGSSITKDDVSNTMLNLGSTPLPYEPYSSEVWHDVPYYVHDTETDTITTLPAELYPTGTTATVGLKGQTVQSGTPSPQNPVMPNGTGERTGNLFDYKSVYASYIDNNGNISTTANNLTSWNYFTEEDIGKTITVSLYVSSISTSYIRVQGQIDGSYITGNAINANQTGYTEITVTPTSTSDRWRITYGTGTPDVVLNRVMVAVSATRKDYEPYGYKLTISSANATTPVYLGEVETTRRAKKLVMTGKEIFYKNYQDNVNDYLYYTSITSYGDSINNVVMCTHLPYTPSIPEGLTIGSRMSNGHKSLYLNFGADVMNLQPSGTTRAGIKEYLAAQYAAGTPVTVWYVLATETTGVVNEPLMKIGNYADMVSNVSIPVTAGGDTLSVGTTVQPSEITANYKGWHPKTPKVSNNGQWS